MKVDLRRAHNQRHHQIAESRRAGLDFVDSNLAAARVIRERYGCVPIKDTEGFFLSEVGLTPGEDTHA